MYRYKLTIEYDGSRFCGWQKQKDQPSVQGVIEQAIFQLSGAQVCVYGSGRTDAGVHATGQVAHADLPKLFDGYRLREALNAHLRGQGVSIVDAKRAGDTFHARFDAIERSYCYKILMRRAPSPLLDPYMLHVPVRLDIDRMMQASQFFIGQHDFESFRSSQCEAQRTVRILNSFDWCLEGDILMATIKARSFLHNQIRIMMGTLINIGKKEKNPEIIKEFLGNKDKTKTGPTAPPHGLYFVGVKYESDL